MSYEKKANELESIIERLKSEDVSLEESLALYSRGIEVGKECLEELAKFKNKIDILNKDLSKLEVEIEEEYDE